MFSVSLFAQPKALKFEHIGLEQGLSQSSVNCVLQDGKGFMWFGTADGLNRFDGYNFVVYRRDPTNLNSLSNNNASSIYEDRSGVLWIGTRGGGLNRFDREKEIFTHYQHDPNNSNSLSHNNISSIYEDRSGVLWIGTRGGGLNKFDREKEKFTHYQHCPQSLNSLSDNDVWSTNEDRFGLLWIGTNKGGLNKFDREKGIFTNYKHDPNNANSLSVNSVLSIYNDANEPKVLWIGTNGGGLSKFDREKEIFTNYRHNPDNSNSLNDNTVFAFYEDPKEPEVLWIGTGNGGLNRFDQKKGTFTHYRHNPDNSNSLSDNNIVSIYEDRSGVLWIGTGSGGLNKLDRQKERFVHYQHHPDNPNSLSDNAVKSIYEDRSGVLWIGTRGSGLDKFDRKKGTFTHYRHDSNNSNSLSSNDVFAIYEDRSGVLWIGTRGGGLNKFDRKKGTFTRYQHDSNNPHSLSHNIISSIYGATGESGVLWIGTYGGLNKFDRKEGFTRYQHDPNNPNSLSDNTVKSIYEDRSGVLWIATYSGGLNKFVREKEIFTHYQHDPNNPNSLSDNHVLSIYEDRRGVLWIGTWGGGLNQYDRNQEKFIHYRERDGSSDVVYGILEDNSGNLWLSTNRGLSKFNPQTKEFKKYDVCDGLQGKEYNHGAHYKSALNGEMFFGGINGFNSFYPDSIKDNPYIAPVVITTLTRYNTEDVAGKPIVDRTISEQREIELSYKDNIFSFEFAALNYRNTLKNQYAYKLEGFNDNWIHLGTKHDVTFTNLDPGEYTLRVKGSNNDGVWNEEGASLRITIHPPWWKTWWAYSLYALLALALFYGIRRSELNRQRLKHEAEMEHLEASKLQEMDRLKSRFFANISHEFRTPLTLILGPLEKLTSRLSDRESRQDLSMMQRNAQRLLQLINQLLDLSKLEAGGMKLQAEPENIVPLLRGLTNSFESLAKQKGIDLRFHASAEEIIAYVEREKIEKIFINLLSNAFKFTSDNGTISVTIDTPLNLHLKRDLNESPFERLSMNLGQNEGCSLKKTLMILSKFCSTF